MEKFLKSIFTQEKRKTSRGEDGMDEDRSDFTPPLDGRRKLSISRSGRMKQANKKRHELSLALYGEDQIKQQPKNMEYHVNKSMEPAENRSRSLDSSPSRSSQKNEEVRRSIENVKTPEEEIESAFEIIDKVS